TDIGIGDEKSGSGLCVVDEMARYGEKERILSYFKTLFFHNLSERVIYCSILFAVSAIILVLFGRFLDVFVADGETGDDGVIEALVTFDGVTVKDEAIFLTADGGADVYALFGYATELVTASELAEAVDGGGTFTVRYTVMDEDEWSGYFRLLDIRDGNGACYLDGSGVISAREAAAEQKMLVLGIITVLCGAACVFYAVVWVRALKKNGK
ncbi:MAG: hypothetical protein IJY04_08075, partial [Clostridia bacterium]|nr:hypothetical protein [Clostridia bacterium]